MMPRIKRSGTATQPTDLSAALQRLRRHPTPIVYDAIERFALRSKQDGYTDPSIRCILPSLGAFVGYAWTGKIVCELPEAEGEHVVPWRDVWASVAARQRPSIAVIQDLDPAPGRGCVWGDVSTAIFQALGCVATVTNGLVRDVRGAERIGFGLFAGGPIVGHANGRFVEIGTPVKVGGLVIAPGDLLHADEHGATIIPAEIDLDDLLRVIDHIVAAEQRVIDYCGRPGFDPDELDRLHTWSMETADGELQ
jgi:regulator of RNase E activity RraA